MRARLVTIVAITALLLVAACQPKKPPSPGAPTLVIDRNFVTGLSNPWDIAFVPGDVNTMFFTERHGPIKVKIGNGAPVELTPRPSDAEPQGEGGVMGIAVDPDFATTRRIYVCYTTASDNRVVPFTVGDFDSLIAQDPIVMGIPKANFHDGCRIRFGPDGNLWITTGDAGDESNPQDRGSLGGKVLRVDRDGKPVAGNLAGPVLTRGHRNPQGIAFRANGEVYTTEHGPDRDDEVNRIVAGANYGWDPGPDYNQAVPMTDTTLRTCPCTPALWSSGIRTIAPSGATFVNGAQWEAWNGALVVAVLKEMRLQVFLDRGGNLDFVAPEVVPMGTRLRSAVQGPDGNLYLATDVGGGGGAIWKVVPT